MRSMTEGEETRHAEMGAGGDATKPPSPSVAVGDTSPLRGRIMGVESAYNRGSVTPRWPIYFPARSA